VIAPTPAISAYAAGQTFRFKAANANTATSTLNVNGIGTKTIVKDGSTVLDPNDIAASDIVQVTYDGTNFQMFPTAFGTVYGNAVLSKTSNYTVAVADKGQVVTITGTSTVTLLAAATAAAGFTVGVVNNGTAIVTIDGNSSETINGSTTLRLHPGDNIIITCDGSNWVGAVNRDFTDVGDLCYSWASSKKGWLLCYGQTIGSVASGADDASAEYEELYAFVWDNVADAEAAVSTGRGASAAADFAADKTLTLPDGRGRSLLGKDNMGGSSANVVTDSEADTLGDVAGEEDHTPIEAEMFAHTHTFGTNQGGGAGDTSVTRNSTADATSETTSSRGSSTAFNLMSPYLTVNLFIRY
jgi:microcystin-dependent protein